MLAERRVFYRGEEVNDTIALYCKAFVVVYLAVLAALMIAGWRK